MDDIFNAFFSQHDVRMGGREGKTKSDDTDVSVNVTLEDLYNGKTVSIHTLRKICCRECSGSGMKRAVKGGNACASCHGSGGKLCVVQNGMMIQQMRVMCSDCNGTGRRIDVKNRCARCHGNKVIVMETPIDVTVYRGMQHAEKICFRGMGNEDPTFPRPGDLVVQLQQEKHQTYTRNGDDLHVTQRVTLAEALCGFQFKLVHLDGRELVVRRQRGTITQPGEQYCVAEEGMPSRKRKGVFGNLLVTFEVVYPDCINGEQLRLLREALPPPKSCDAASRTAQEQCYVSRQSWDMFREEIAKDDDENNGDTPQGAQHVGCQPA